MLYHAPTQAYRLSCSFEIPESCRFPSQPWGKDPPVQLFQDQVYITVRCLLETQDLWSEVRNDNVMLTLRNFSRLMSAYLSSKSLPHPFFNTPTRQSARPPASQRPVVSPIPPNGLFTWAASPASKTLPTRNLSEHRWCNLYGENICMSYLRGLGPGNIALYLFSRLARASSYVSEASSP